MHTNNSFETGRCVLDEPFDATPEELVEHGDIDAMRRFLMLAGDGEQQDAARQSLYAAAANGLCQSRDKSRVYRMCVYGWPVTFCHSSPVVMGSNIHLTSPRYAGHSSGPQGLLLKVRELWSRAFGSEKGVQVSPIIWMTSLSSVLGLTPLTLRDATRHGLSIIQGVKQPTTWRFDRSGASQVRGNADLPLSYLMAAWVCWDVHGHVPRIQLGNDLTMEAQQLVRAIGACRDGAAVDAMIGRPAVYHDAITQGQALHLAAMSRSAWQKDMNFSVQISQDALNMRVDMGYVDTLSGDIDYVQEWCYPHIWRPMDHLSSIQAYEQHLPSINLH